MGKFYGFSRGGIMIKKYKVIGSWSQTMLGNPELVIKATNRLMDMYPHLNMQVIKVEEIKLENLQTEDSSIDNVDMDIELELGKEQIGEEE